MELIQAQNISQEIIDKLSPFCQPGKCVVAGSIRRRKPFVHDIDIVCIVEHEGPFLAALQSMGKIKSGAGKLIRLGMGFSKGIDADIYIATPKTWATLLLIRTGSKEHNIKLCSLARQHGMVLHADGRGLAYPPTVGIENGQQFEHETFIKCDTEESIFKALGLPYKRPEERN
jgi:DNA polymerase/3'-5' exonuclease PolX